MKNEKTLFTIIITFVRLMMDKGDKEITGHKALANLMRRERTVGTEREGSSQE